MKNLIYRTNTKKYNICIKNDTGDIEMDYLIKDDCDNFTFIEIEKNKLKKQILSEYVALRKEKKLSQEDISNLTGIARPNISRIERGKYDPTLEILTKLASALDMKLEIRFVERKE